MRLSVRGWAVLVLVVVGLDLLIPCEGVLRSFAIGAGTVCLGIAVGLVVTWARL